MHAKNLIPLFLVILAARALALSPEGRKSGEELVTTLKEEMKALAGNDENQNELMSIRQYLRQIEAALTQESNRQIQQILENFGNYVPTEKVAKLVESISQDLRDETARKIQAVIGELEGTLAAAAEAVERAEEPEDLDKVIVSLSRNRFNNGDGEYYNSSHPGIRSLLSDVSSARQFATGWQDYLQASNAGNTAKAVQALRNLSSQEGSLVPRSQIIARVEYELENEDKTNKILEQVKKPDDMKEAIRKLTRLMGGSRSSSSENAGSREALQTLARLEKTYREHLAGLPVNVEVLQSPDDAGGGTDFSHLRAALLLLVLPRALDLPEGFTPAPGEGVDGFLARAIEDARRREDVATVLRVSGVRQSFVRSANLSAREMEALTAYTAGQNQYAAGQHLLAVVSLQQALKTGSDLVPVKKAGALLETIRRDHPVEFEQGMMEFLTPRAAPDFGYSRMPYRNHIPQGMRYDDGISGSQGGTTIVIPVSGSEVAGDKPPEAAKAGKPEKTDPGGK
jgi:hypothetical protein